MATRCVWTCSVEWERAFDLLLSGCGRLIDRWNEQTWRYWRELGWDQRPSSELNKQPPEVQVYSLNALEIWLLGVLPEEPTSALLFVLPDIRWAAVVSEVRLERVDDEDVAEDV